MFLKKFLQSLNNTLINSKFTWNRFYSFIRKQKVLSMNVLKRVRMLSLKRLMIKPVNNHLMKINGSFFIYSVIIKLLH